MIELLLPPALSLPSALGLIALSALTSFITAALGIGGGVIMLAAMTAILPAAAIIPVHAVVQVGSNAGRFAVMFGHVQWRLVAVIGLGGIVGIAFGGMIVIEMPATALRITLALFILWSVWLPRPHLARMGYAGASVGGIVASFLTMFVGATGPFIMAILRSFELGRLELVASHAASMTLQHAMKMVAFGLLGFAFAPWLPLILAMIAGGLLGTVIGRRVLLKTPEKRFRAILKWLLTIVAVLLIARSLIGFLAGN